MMTLEEEAQEDPSLSPQGDGGETGGGFAQACGLPRQVRAAVAGALNADMHLGQFAPNVADPGKLRESMRAQAEGTN
jgi:hypothetical protein